MKYNKLVRDKIPEIIKNEGKAPLTHIANGEEYKKKLYEKLSEETQEFLNNPSKEEIADILEVIDSICELNKINKNDLELIKNQKLIKKGSFKNRIILDEVR